MTYIYRIAMFLCVFAFAYPLAASAQAMGHTPPTPMTPLQFSQSYPGQSVQIAVRVVRINRTEIVADLLQQQTETTSRTSGKQVTLYFADGTPVVMGTARDIVPGAVLFVYGIVTKANTVDVKRAVVDTAFVKVL